jgi:zinc protease
MPPRPFFARTPTLRTPLPSFRSPMTIPAMKPPRRFRTGRIAGVLALPLALAATVAPTAHGAHSGAPARALAVANDTDSLPRDPALEVGTLPNGMRYYIRVNKSPVKRAMLWLAVNAGSIQEDDDQQGFAHFLEHMAFNGTKHYPRHELISTLQLAGMRFGADINASTGYEETVYKLEVPTDDRKSLGQGLTMLQDWAGGGMLIDSSEVLAERGVVLGEWRSGLPDTLSQQVRAHDDSVLFGPESRYATRSPIGLTKLLETAQPGPIRRFYKEWYRPDLMAVIAVGDFDPKEMRREIIARFSTIARASNPRPHVSPRLPSSSDAVTDIYEGMMFPSITVLWRPDERAVETKAGFREELIGQLLIDRLQSRFRRLSQQSGRPFISAGIDRTRLTRANEGTILEVVGWPTDSLEHALAAALAEVERVAQHGLPDAAIAHDKAAMLRRYESAATDQAAQSSGDYVNTYVQQYLQGGGPLLNAEQELALVREILPTIAAKDLAQAARFWQTREDRLTLVKFPKFFHERVPTQNGIAAIFDSVAALHFAPDSSRALVEEPLMPHLPSPGRIVGERRFAKSGVSEWTLSNGARVLFKQSGNDPDEVLIRAVSPGGTSLLPDTLFFSPGRMVDRMMTQAAGLGTHDRFGLEDQLSSSVVRQFEVAMTPTEEGLRLSGSPKDLTTLFQLLYLQFTAPKLDTAALSLWKQGGSPGGFSFDDVLNTILSQGNRRLAPTSWTLMPLADTATAMAVYRDRFGNAGDFTFIIVGAASPAQMRPLVERYVASLPGTQKREQPKDLGVYPWDHLSRSSQRVFDVPRASTYILFEGAFPSAPDAYLAERRRLDALSWVLRLKFTDDLREQMGGTYGVGVQAWTTAVPQEHYRFAINFDAAPERMGGMLDTMFTILDTVRASGATAIEIKKVNAMQRRGWETQLEDNHYWLKAIELYDRLKIPLDRIVTPPSSMLTAADISATARQYLPTTAYIHVTTLPQDSTLFVKTDSATRAQTDTVGKARPKSIAGVSLMPIAHSHH